MIRRIAAGLLALIAAWLLWQGIVPVLHIVSLGSPLGDALLQPYPTSLWRIVAAGLALAGSGLAMFGIRGGVSMAITGAILFAALAVGMAAMGTSFNELLSDALPAAALLVLAGALLFMKRA